MVFCKVLIVHTFRHIWLSLHVFIMVIRAILHEETQNRAEQQPKNRIVENLVVSQNSFRSINLLTHVSLNTLKLCISGRVLWRYSSQNIGRQHLHNLFSNSESQLLSATCTSIKPDFQSLRECPDGQNNHRNII